jgi:hypothetical protein
VEPLRTPLATLYDGATATATLLALACLIGKAAGLLLAVLALVPLAGEVLGRSWNLDLFPSRRGFSQNVVALAHDAAPRLLLAAHLDSQRATALFHPRLRDHLKAVFSATNALLAAILALGSSPDFVPGADDNASGVAVATALAARLRAAYPQLPFALVLTGAEEVGARGMASFVRRHLPPSVPKPPLLVVDNVGAAPLRFLPGEGMALPFRYDPTLLRHARELARRRPDLLAPGVPPLLPTDALVYASRRWPTIAFLGQDDAGRIPHYHWYDDVADFVDETHLARVVDALFTYVAELLADDTLGLLPPA